MKLNKRSILAIVLALAAGIALAWFSQANAATGPKAHIEPWLSAPPPNSVLVSRTIKHRRDGSMVIHSRYRLKMRPNGTRQLQQTSVCPNYVQALWIDPTTGGATMVTVDACADGAAAYMYVDSTEVLDATATASGLYQGCRTVKDTFRSYSRDLPWIGKQQLIGSRLTKYWCWKGQQVTYAPSASTDSWVTSYGSDVGWHNSGRSSFDEHWLNDPTSHVGHHSWARWHMYQRVCVLKIAVCQTIRNADPALFIDGWYRGMYQKT